MTLTEADSDTLVDGIRTGRLDLALVGLAGDPPAGIESRVIIDEPLVAAVTHGDALAARRTVGRRRLAQPAHVGPPLDPGLRAALDDACASAGVEANVAFEARDPGVVAQLAERGLGVAILPTSVAEAHSATLHALTVTRPSLRSRMELAWRADGPASPAARALVEHVRRQPDRGRTGEERAA